VLCLTKSRSRAQFLLMSDLRWRHLQAVNLVGCLSSQPPLFFLTEKLPAHFPLLGLCVLLLLLVEQDPNLSFPETRATAEHALGAACQIRSSHGRSHGRDVERKVVWGREMPVEAVGKEIDCVSPPGGGWTMREEGEVRRKSRHRIEMESSFQLAVMLRPETCV
jgi:hypothetical protein